MRVLKKIAFSIVRLVVAVVAIITLPLVTLICRFFSPRGERPRLVWGADPIINNKYWSNALAKAGFYSKTWMFSYQSVINRPDDFDLDIYHLIKFRWGFLQKIFSYFLSPYAAFVCALRQFDIFHHSFRGGFLGDTLLWQLEAPLLKLARKKTVIIPYGADAYMYSKIIDPCLRHALLLYNPKFARTEAHIQRRVAYWTKHADIIMTGILIDGIGRWDLLPFSMLTIDTEQWEAKKSYSSADGRTGVVKVMHAPNHRVFKGTEFLIQAVEELQAEGLKVELLLVEKKQNEEIRRLMKEQADIMADQFVATMYGLTGVEAMSCGLPVITNLEHEVYTRLFRLYSYLDECPALSTTPELMKENLRLLVTSPALREALGRAGRLYVEKYHSEETARYMFGAIYDRLWYQKDVDLMNLFHPLLSEYNRRTPHVRHSLADNNPPRILSDAETLIS